MSDEKRDELEKELIEAVAHALGYMESCGYHDMPLLDSERDPEHYIYLDLKTSLDAFTKARSLTPSTELEAEIKRLRKALEEIADIHPFEGPLELAAYANENRLKSVTIAARDALKGPGHE